jgi:protein-S-isoprenylcysteine O-methyltransferase Ste14
LAKVYSDPFFAFSVGCWVLLWIYWLFSARNQKSEKRREPPAERLRQILPMALVYLLLFDPAARIGWLGRGLAPDSVELELAGAALTAAGVAFAIWARHHLGSNWSARVTIRAGHELVSSGPYRRIRHPIYTGMILAAVGTAAVIGETRGVIAVVICCAAFYFKARKEERWLAEEFGERFRSRVEHTGMFLPRFS